MRVRCIDGPLPLCPTTTIEDDVLALKGEPRVQRGAALVCDWESFGLRNQLNFVNMTLLRCPRNP